MKAIGIDAMVEQEKVNGLPSSTFNYLREGSERIGFVIRN